MKFGGRVQWVKNVRMGLEAFGWQGLDMQALNGLSLSKVKHLLKCMAWRKARAHPKLEVMGRLMDCRCKAKCVEVDCKRQKMLMKLRGGTAELRIETGRWYGLRRDEQSCKMCNEREMKDVEHFYCTVMVWQRRERR